MAVWVTREKRRVERLDELANHGVSQSENEVPDLRCTAVASASTRDHAKLPARLALPAERA